MALSAERAACAATILNMMEDFLFQIEQRQVDEVDAEEADSPPLLPGLSAKFLVPPPSPRSFTLCVCELLLHSIFSTPRRTLFAPLSSQPCAFWDLRAELLCSLVGLRVAAAAAQVRFNSEDGAPIKAYTVSMAAEERVGRLRIELAKKLEWPLSQLRIVHHARTLTADDYDSLTIVDAHIRRALQIIDVVKCTRPEPLSSAGTDQHFSRCVPV